MVIIIWLVVSIPLNNMSSSVGNIVPNTWKVIKIHGSKPPTSIIVIIISGWFQPLWKIWVRQWEGWHPIYEMVNKKWLKPPTRYVYIRLYIYIIIYIYNYVYIYIIPISRRRWPPVAISHPDALRGWRSPSPWALEVEIWDFGMENSMEQWSEQWGGSMKISMNTSISFPSPISIAMKIMNKIWNNIHHVHVHSYPLDSTSVMDYSLRSMT